MGNIWDFIVAHQTVVAMVAYWLFSNFVSALPSPNNASGMGYKFLFAFCHGLSGSIPRVIPSTRLFGDPTQGSATYFKTNGTPTPVTPPPATPGNQP